MYSKSPELQHIERVILDEMTDEYSTGWKKLREEGKVLGGREERADKYDISYREMKRGKESKAPAHRPLTVRPMN